MKEGSHFVEICCTAMIDYGNASEVDLVLLCDGPNLLFIAKHRDLGQSVTRADRGCDDCAWIVSFPQNDVLQPAGGALTNIFQNVHRNLGV